MPDDEDVEHTFDGFYSYVTCGVCFDTFEVEGDPRGDEVECTSCGTAANVA